MVFSRFFKHLVAIARDLRITVALLILAMLLVFLSTLEQVHLGIHEVQNRYFAQWLAWVPLPHTPGMPNFLAFIRIPLLGGYALGTAFLLNLIAASPRIFKSGLKNIGIILTHLGILTLIISGFLSAYFQEESQLWVRINHETHYSESTYENEWVLIDESMPNYNTVYALPAHALEPGKWIEIPSIPFRFKIHNFFPNASLAREVDNPTIPTGPANRGVAAKMGLNAIPLPPTYKEEERNAATAYIEVFSKEGESLGIWLLSNIIDERFPAQGFDYEGKHYSLALRFKRDYLPISFKLIEFTHKTYPNTNIPKAFISKLELLEGQTSRQVIIQMNEPLRTHGYAFYQASFAPDEQASMLQVVKNPAWLGPYAGVLLLALGLVYHFAFMLIRFLSHQRH